MGPISATDMAAWLLQGAAPRQLSRPCHKPLLDMVAADRSQLLVCGVLAAEVQQVLMSGEAPRTVLACLPRLALCYVCYVCGAWWSAAPYQTQLGNLQSAQLGELQTNTHTFHNLRLDCAVLLLQESWPSCPCMCCCQLWLGAWSTPLSRTVSIPVQAPVISDLQARLGLQDDC
jgi:hypothetical protein